MDMEDAIKQRQETTFQMAAAEFNRKMIDLEDRLTSLLSDLDQLRSKAIKACGRSEDMQPGL